MYSTFINKYCIDYTKFEGNKIMREYQKLLPTNRQARQSVHAATSHPDFVLTSNCNVAEINYVKLVIVIIIIKKA